MKRTIIGLLTLALIGFCFNGETTGQQKEKAQESVEKGDRQERRGKRGRRGNRMREDNAPKVGDVAPTFKLKSLDGESETDLGDFRDNKPVVLIFGSYT